MNPDRPTLTEVLSAGTLEGVELGWSDTLFCLLNWIGRTVTVATRSAEAITSSILIGEFREVGWLDNDRAEPDEAIYLLIGEATIFISRPEFVAGMERNGELHIEAGGVTITLGGVRWEP